MDCKKAMELMTQFINEQLDAGDVQAFLDHIDSCPECREELEVTYSLMTAMKQLDEDTDLSDNYIEELNQKIETCYLDELKRKRSCVRRRILLGIVVFLLLFMNGITVKDTRREEDRRFFRMITEGEVPRAIWPIVIEPNSDAMVTEEQKEEPDEKEVLPSTEEDVLQDTNEE